MLLKYFDKDGWAFVDGLRDVKIKRFDVLETLAQYDKEPDQTQEFICADGSPRSTEEVAALKCLWVASIDTADASNPKTRKNVIMFSDQVALEHMLPFVAIKASREDASVEDGFFLVTNKPVYLLNSTTGQTIEKIM